MKHKPYLLQRLQQPCKSDHPLAKEDLFSFGGGMRHGGLSQEFFKLLSQIWSYDYMGAAEFEFGALPESWKRIYENHKQYVLGSVDVIAKYTNYAAQKMEKLRQSATIYYFCDKADEEEIKNWIIKFADEDKHDFSTKEYVGLGCAICSPSSRETKGWHDLDNDFLFFCDKEMFDTMVKVLEL